MSPDSSLLKLLHPQHIVMPIYIYGNIRQMGKKNALQTVMYPIMQSSCRRAPSCPWAGMCSCMACVQTARNQSSHTCLHACRDELQTHIVSLSHLLACDSDAALMMMRCRQPLFHPNLTPLLLSVPSHSLGCSARVCQQFCPVSLRVHTCTKQRTNVSPLTY